MGFLKKSLFVLFLLSAQALDMMAEEVVDITSRFTYCWGSTEEVIHNTDGTITYEFSQGGGLVYSIGDEDWTLYSHLVFELAEPSPCSLKPRVLYTGETNSDDGYMEAGVRKASVELTLSKRRHVRSAALQANGSGTLHINRIYLVKEATYGERKGQLRINELMQSNVDCIMDDLNEFPDSWVELYNSGTTPVNLVRYRLGLTADANKAWQLPSQTIVEPGAFVLVYCDKVGRGLHTDFRLESGNEASVYLFLDGELDDGVTNLKKQPSPNIAYGRATESDNRWGYQYEPTPGAANCGRLCSKVLEEPVFSLPGVVLTHDSILQLQLKTAPGSPNVTTIRYTTDGSEPTANSKEYTSPITVSSTMTIRAKAFCDGWLSPRSTTQSYIFLNRDMTTPVISLVTDSHYWDDDKIGILTNNNGDIHNDWRRPVNIEFFEVANCNSELNQLCEMRVGGNTSRAYNLKSLIIYANKRFGVKRLEHEFFPDQRPGIMDFKSLMLRNGGSDYYSLYLRDAIIQRTMSTHTDLDWQAWRPAIIFENGDYKGMLNIRERSNEDNIFTNYEHLEDIDMIENWWDLKEGSLTNFNNFKAFYQVEGHTMSEYEQWIECTEFTNWMLMELYFNNMDFPGTNSMIWRPHEEGGRWRFIAKDTDLGLGSLSLPPDYPILNWFYSPEYDPRHSWGQNNASSTLLFRRLMEDDSFRKQFLDRATVYMGDFLNERGTRTVWDPMYELIKYEYPYHRARIDDGKFPDYDYEMSKARQWLSQRTDCFYQHLSDFYHLGTPIPATINLEADISLPDDLTVTINGIPLTTSIFDGKFFVGQEISLDVLSSSQHVAGWKVEQVDNHGTKSQREVEGAQYTFYMPACDSLALQIVMKLSNMQETAAQNNFEDAWYTLDGRRLSQRPMREGLYLHKGRKYAVKKPGLAVTP